MSFGHLVLRAFQTSECSNYFCLQMQETVHLKTQKIKNKKTLHPNTVIHYNTNAWVEEILYHS